MLGPRGGSWAVGLRGLCPLLAGLLELEWVQTWHDARWRWTHVASYVSFV